MRSTSRASYSWAAVAWLWLPACHSVLAIEEADLSRDAGASGTACSGTGTEGGAAASTGRADEAGGGERPNHGGTQPVAGGSTQGAGSVPRGGSDEPASGGLGPSPSNDGRTVAGTAGAAATSPAGGASGSDTGETAGPGGSAVGGAGAGDAGDLTNRGGSSATGVAPSSGGAVGAGGVSGAAGAADAGAGGAGDTSGIGGTAATGGAAGSAGAGGMAGMDDGQAGAAGTAGTAGSPACPDDTSSNADHCGWCGHSCLGTSCNDGLCQASGVDSSSEHGGFRVAGASSEIVWGSGSELRHAKGTVPFTGKDLLSGLTQTGGVVVDGTDYIAAVDSRLVRGPLDGSAAPVSIYEGTVEIQAVTADETSVYFVPCRYLETSAAGILQLDRHGTLDDTPTVVVTATELGSYWCPWQLGIDSEAIWFVNPGQSNSVYRVDRADPKVEVFWNIGGTRAYALAIDDEYVYVSTRNEVGLADSIYRKRKNGNGDIETLTSSEAFPTKLLVYQGSLYYATAGGQPLEGSLGEIKRLDLGSGESPRVLAVEQAWPRDLAIDGGWLYWTGGLWGTSGYLRRVAR